MPDLPATETLSAFAARLGCRPSYITELKQAGRLILTADGKAVRVAESLAHIHATQSPAWDGVRERNAAVRGTPLALPGDGDETLDSEDHDTPAATGRNSEDVLRTRRAKRISAEVQARKDMRSLQELEGKLVDVAEVRAAAAEAGAIVRRRLETLPTLISAQVDERDRDRVYTAITDTVTQTLTDLERAFTRAHARKETA